MTLSDPRLNHVLKNWQEYNLKQEPVLVKEFTAGLNHSTYLLQVEKNKLVVKIFSEPSPNAVKVQQWAAEIGIAPTIKFLNQDQDLILMEYVDSTTIDPAHLSQKELEELGRALHLLHRSPSAPLQSNLGKFDLLRFCDGYLVGLNKEIQSVHTCLLPALEIFIADQTVWTLCHNDLVKENCFVNLNQASFIDWEYAQLHNPWFDLAAIILYSNLSKDQVKIFLNAYQQGWSEKVGTQIYYSAQCALLWVDMLWHLDKIGMEYSSSMGCKWIKLRELANHLDLRVEI